MKKQTTPKHRLDAYLLKLEATDGLHAGDLYDGLLEIVEASMNGEFNDQTIFKNIFPAFLRHRPTDNLLERYRKIKKLGSVATHEKMCLIHGDEEGTRRWNAYCDRQAETNTFAYKQKVHGFTKEQFDEYNASRACTLDNMIHRHGESEGRAKWDAYVARQTYAGCSIDYFTELYGEEEGTRKYLEIKKLKSNSVKSYIERFGEEEGVKRFEEYASTRTIASGVSRISQELFDAISVRIPYVIGNVYYKDRNKEFGKIDILNRCYYFYDFVIPSLGVIIEFNGDIYHANPAVYEASDVPPYPGNTRTAQEIWDYDARKLALARDLGFDVRVVWENEYVNDKEKVINELVEYIFERSRNN